MGMFDILPGLKTGGLSWRDSRKSKYDFSNYISDDVEIQNEYLYKWK